MRCAPRAAVRWVGPETFHITLQFLGETQKAEGSRRRLHGQRQAVTVTFRGAGFFPNPNRARVFWAGIEGDEKPPTLVNESAPLLRRSDSSASRRNTIPTSRWRAQAADDRMPGRATRLHPDCNRCA